MPSNASLRLRRQFQEELGTREEAQQRFRATIGDGAGNIEVPGKRNFVYVRREGRSRVEECHNTKVPRRNGLPVIVGYDPINPDTLQILEPDWGGMAAPDNYSYVPFHHESHEFQNTDGGDDVTWIQSQQYVPLLAYPTDPTSMTVNVYGGWYCWSTDWHYFEATVSADLTGSIPGIVGNARYTLISIDGATEALQYTDGAEFPIALPPADIEDMIPTAPGGSVPIVAVYLPNGLAAIDWANLYDIRMMVATAGMLVDHGHSAVGDGGALDWDAVAAAPGADVVHDHSAAGEGGEVPLASLGSYAQGRIIKGGGADWDTLAHPGGVQRLLESTAAEVQWALTDDGNAFNTVVRTDANAAIRPNRLGVGAAAPNQDGAIAQAEIGAAPTNVAGVGMQFFMDDGGQTKAYFEDDAGNVFEKAGIIEDVTVTVGGGGDFATIQDAIDWFKNWIVKGTCYIDVDAGAYDEAVVFANLLIAPGAYLVLRGDTRVLAGLTYIDGVAANRASLANGGSGTCALSIDGTRTVITVTGATTSPDFDADGWVNGDRILVFADDGNQYERIISATLNNTITITVALPAGATVGNDGTAVALVPDRSIERSVAGICCNVVGCEGVALSGWYLESSTGASCNGLGADAGAFVYVSAVLVYAEDYGALSGATSYAVTSALFGARTLSLWGCATGAAASLFAGANIAYAQAVGCTTGFLSQINSVMYPTLSAAVNCTTAYSCTNQSQLTASSAYARQNTTGFSSVGNSLLMADTTMAYLNGNITDYSPNPGGAGQYAESAANFGVLYKS